MKYIIDDIILILLLDNDNIKINAIIENIDPIPCVTAFPISSNKGLFGGLTTFFFWYFIVYKIYKYIPNHWTIAPIKTKKCHIK